MKSWSTTSSAALYIYNKIALFSTVVGENHSFNEALVNNNIVNEYTEQNVKTEYTDKPE